MHLNKALPNSVSLFHDDFEWIHTLDYEHVPFRCRKCHANGPLFRDYPLNVKPTTNATLGLIDQEGFTKVNPRKKSHKKIVS